MTGKSLADNLKKNYDELIIERKSALIWWNSLTTEEKDTLSRILFSDLLPKMTAHQIHLLWYFKIYHEEAAKQKLAAIKEKTDKNTENERADMGNF